MSGRDPLHGKSRNDSIRESCTYQQKRAIRQAIRGRQGEEINTGTFNIRPNPGATRDATMSRRVDYELTSRMSDVVVFRKMTKSSQKERKAAAVART